MQTITRTNLQPREGGSCIQPIWHALKGPLGKSECPGAEKIVFSGLCLGRTVQGHCISLVALEMSPH